MLNMLGLLDSPTSGKIVIDSVDVSSLDREREGLISAAQAWIRFPVFSLLMEFKAVENVALR